MYVRYKQVGVYLESVDQAKRRTLYILNKASWFIGILICIGMSLVANFQVVLSCMLVFIGNEFTCGTRLQFFKVWIEFLSNASLFAGCHLMLL